MNRSVSSSRRAVVLSAVVFAIASCGDDSTVTAPTVSAGAAGVGGSIAGSGGNQAGSSPAGSAGSIATAGAGGASAGAGGSIAGGSKPIAGAGGAIAGAGGAIAGAGGSKPIAGAGGAIAGAGGSKPIAGAGGSSGDAGSGGAAGSGGSNVAGSAGAGGMGPPLAVRITAANLTSGKNQSYDPGEGMRILEALKPDVVMIQEFNYMGDADADIRSFVDTTFGPTFDYRREEGVSPSSLPNGVISRFKILGSGRWNDDDLPSGSRGFFWARIDLPGDKELFVVSCHWHTDVGSHADEATAIVTQMQALPNQDDYFVVGGDFNAKTRDDLGVANLAARFQVKGPFPVDNLGNDNSNEPRTKPDDWVLASPNLDGLQVPTVIATQSFAHGLVFDSRVYTPLTDVTPVLLEDSDGADFMQHMAIVKDFEIPTPEVVGP